jgi:hypothetical protein
MSWIETRQAHGGIYIRTGARLKDPPVSTKDSGRLSFPPGSDHLHFLLMLHNNQFKVIFVMELPSERSSFVSALCMCFGSLREQTQRPAHE